MMSYIADATSGAGTRPLSPINGTTSTIGEGRTLGCQWRICWTRKMPDSHLSARRGSSRLTSDQRKGLRMKGEFSCVRAGFG